jgi:holin-like protein
MPLGFITLLLVCQLAGEVIRLALDLPVPGPVIGMALLFGGLVVRGSVPEGLSAASSGLLQHLALLFVPAGVGVITHIGLLQAEWQPVAAALVGSTLAAVVVTALVLRWLMPKGDGTK